MYINIKLLPCVVEVTAADVVVVTGAVDVKDSAVVVVAASDVTSVAVGVEASVV